MKLLFLDCQTTGMHPSTGHLLELAWESELGPREFLVRLPEGEKIPHRVTELTGLRAEHLEGSAPPEDVLTALEEDLASLGEGGVVVAHYAQFERAFLTALIAAHRGSAGLPWRMLCTYQLARRLHPEVPSRNIRALVGYFGLAEGEVRRAVEHVTATRRIWERMAAELPVRVGSDYEALVEWIRETKAPKVGKLEFRVGRERRLGLPDRPGVYRMLSREGRVLYVGKATSLRDRVNSYFRGKRGPGPRKREMLARTFDFEITECGSALEAALLESEEIKRLDPPYNVSLKAGNRSLRFFSRDFSAAKDTQDVAHPLGPFGRSNSIEILLAWRVGAEAGEAEQIFHDEVPPDTLRAGHEHFLSALGLRELPPMRSLLALGLKLIRKLDALEVVEVVEVGAEEDVEDENAVETPLTAEEVGARYESLLLRAAREYLRAKSLTRLLDCHVVVEPGARALEVRGGRIGGALGASGVAPWSGLGIADYDRMSVLLTEIHRHGYAVESRRRPW